MKSPIALFLITLLAPVFLHAQNTLPEVWEVGDGDNGTYLIKLLDGNLARSSYHKGDSGYLGEIGYWHRHGNVTTIFYDSGWSDRIIRSEDGLFTKHGYSPTTELGDKPSNTSPAKQIPDQPLFEPVAAEKFIGIWRLYDEHGEVFYLETKADRTARSSYAGGAEGVFGETGVWRHEGNRITIAYNSGWVNIIVFGGGKFKKYSYNPDQIIAGKFDNTSTAELVDPIEAGVKHR